MQQNVPHIKHSRWPNYLQLAVIMLLGMAFILFFALLEDINHNRNPAEPAESDETEDNSARTRSLIETLPLLAVIGGLVAVVCNLRLFSGSDVASPILQRAWLSGGQEQTDLLWNAAAADVIRAICICLEIMTVPRIEAILREYPTLRESSDHIRTAMNLMLELALFVGGILAVMKLEPSASQLALMIYVLLYAANEGTGFPVIRDKSTVSAYVRQ